MPVARLLRLLLTLFVLVSGPTAALGCAAMAAPRSEAVTPISSSDNALSCAGRHDRSEQSERRKGSDQVRLLAADVGHSANSQGSGSVRSASRGRSVLASLLSRALGSAGDTAGDTQDELEAGDTADLADDDGPQGFVGAVWSEPMMARRPTPYIETNLRGIQPSLGHPRGDDEPPRL
jgi:hypothetical protein